MNKFAKHEKQILEIMLIAVSIALTALVYKMDAYRMVTLNLFYLPVVLSGFYLGRYYSGVLALFCVISASLVAVTHLTGFAATLSPLATGLSVTIWGATLCMTAILVGTLSEERAAQASELHDAYVGVVEVLSKYLQGGNPRLKARTIRVAEISQRVATELRLSPRRIDDIRVAALMQDLGTIEITTKVISKAVDSLESKTARREHYSFHGTDLVHSLGAVLKGAIPILLNQDNPLPALADGQLQADVPIGAKVIQVVRAFDALTVTGIGGQTMSAEEALAEMRRDYAAAYDADVLAALANVAEDLEPAVAV